jgi:ligand-binding SRPBCC domain-containing protein
MRHTLHYCVELPLPQKEVFDFFADVANLQRITPPWLNFSIRTPLPISMEVGAVIDFRLSLLGVPFEWKTEISAWQPPDMFIDRQINGPYAEWIHRHTFRTIDEGRTVMEDDVTYSLPSQPLGELVHPLVRSQLEKIFSYRQETILKILQGAPV